jgi:hypothetical protein
VLARDSTIQQLQQEAAEAAAEQKATLNKVAAELCRKEEQLQNAEKRFASLEALMTRIARRTTGTSGTVTTALDDQHAFCREKATLPSSHGKQAKQQQHSHGSRYSD